MGVAPLLSAADSALVLIDMQTAFEGKLLDEPRVVEQQKRLIAVARELGVPVLLTEHYPKGLGGTIPPIVEALGGEGSDSLYQPIEKISFSAWGEDGFRAAVEATRARSLVLAGIETHICVCQTALEAAAAGYEVHVVADAVTARNDEGRQIGLQRMAQFGIRPDTVEMVVYQWLRRADTPEFKACLKHVK